MRGDAVEVATPSPASRIEVRQSVISRRASVMSSRLTSCLWCSRARACDSRRIASSVRADVKPKPPPPTWPGEEGWMRSSSGMTPQATAGETSEVLGGRGRRRSRVLVGGGRGRSCEVVGGHGSRGRRAPPRPLRCASPRTRRRCARPRPRARWARTGARVRHRRAWWWRRWTDDYDSSSLEEEETTSCGGGVLGFA